MKNVRENLMILCNRHPRSVKEMVEILKVSQGTISYHLKKLIEEEIFDKKKEKNKVGQPTTYSCRFIMDDDWNFCYFCGGEEKAQNHHIIPMKKGGEDVRENILKLCKSCHKNIHSHKWFLYISNGHFFMVNQKSREIIKYPSMQHIYDLRNPPINSIKNSLKDKHFNSKIKSGGVYRNG